MPSWTRFPCWTTQPLRGRGSQRKSRCAFPADPPQHSCVSLNMSQRKHDWRSFLDSPTSRSHDCTSTLVLPELIRLGDSKLISCISLASDGISAIMVQQSMGHWIILFRSIQIFPCWLPSLKCLRAAEFGRMHILSSTALARSSCSPRYASGGPCLLNDVKG